MADQCQWCQRGGVITDNGRAICDIIRFQFLIVLAYTNIVSIVLNIFLHFCLIVLGNYCEVQKPSLIS
jgi:hypothetical protein